MGRARSDHAYELRIVQKKCSPELWMTVATCAQLLYSVESNLATQSRASRTRPTHLGQVLHEVDVLAGHVGRALGLCSACDQRKQALSRPHKQLGVVYAGEGGRPQLAPVLLVPPASMWWQFAS